MTVAAKNKTILLIDDDVDFVSINQQALEASGFKVLAAYDSQEGFKSIKAQKPDLIVLDVMMKTVDEGITFAQQLNGDSELSDIPVFLLTSMAHTPQFPTHFDALFAQPWPAAVTYLEKPINAERLVSEISQVLGL
ncbi:MAG TPA: response regulator [Chroococcales cyanobacterium]